jgi:hypothetical protein
VTPWLARVGGCYRFISVALSSSASPGETVGLHILHHIVISVHFMLLLVRSKRHSEFYLHAGRESSTLRRNDRQMGLEQLLGTTELPLSRF